MENKENSPQELEVGKIGYKAHSGYDSYDVTRENKGDYRGFTNADKEKLSNHTNHMKSSNHTNHTNHTNNTNHTNHILSKLDNPKNNYNKKNGLKKEVNEILEDPNGN